MPSSRESLQKNSKILEEGWICAKVLVVRVGVWAPNSGRIIMLLTISYDDFYFHTLGKLALLFLLPDRFASHRIRGLNMTSSEN